MNFFRLMNRAPRLVMALLMLFMICSPAHAGEWILDRYVWNGQAQSESLLWAVDEESSPAYSYGDLNRYKINVRDNVHINSRPNSTSWPHRTIVNTNGRWPYPYSAAEFIYRGELPEANGYVRSSVYAVFKWHRRKIRDAASKEVDDPSDDPPKTLYVRETSSISASKSIGTYDGWSTYPIFNQNSPWNGNYYDVKASNSLGGSIGEAIPVWGHTASWIYPYLPPKNDPPLFVRIDVGGDEVRMPTVSFDANIDLSLGYEEHVITHSNAQVDFSYSAEQLYVSALSPDPNNLGVDDCSEPRKGLNQYVITDGIPTSITVQGSAAGVEWLRTKSSWTLEGSTPPLRGVDRVAVVNGNTIRPEHDLTQRLSNGEPDPFYNISDVYKAGLLFRLWEWSQSTGPPAVNHFPSDNSQFGEKTLNHIVDGKTIPAKVALFYPSTGKQHPEGGPKGFDGLAGQVEIATPNWLYYYDKAWQHSSGIKIYYYPGGTSRYKWQPNYGYYQRDYIWVSDDAHGSKGTSTYLFGRVRAANGTLGPLQIVGQRNLKGIDTYAAIISHECTHKLCADYINNGGYADVDQDGVPDDWEVQAGLNPRVTDSLGFTTNITVVGELGNAYDASQGDDEVFARMHEREVDPDIDKDWADDGLNYGKANYTGTPPKPLGPSRCKRVTDYPEAGVNPDLSNVEWPSLP